MTDAPIEMWHVTISGFLQPLGRPTGMIRLWRLLHEAHVGPKTAVVSRQWSDSTSNLAEHIWRYQPGYTRQPIVKVYGYSWGGYSAVRLACALADRGIPVEAMVLTDPVYRHSYALGQWRALVPWSRIIVPANVRDVYWFRQSQNLPRAHELVAVDPQRTTIHDPRWLDVVHECMDDHVAFVSTALRVACEGGDHET